MKSGHCTSQDTSLIRTSSPSPRVDVLIEEARLLSIRSLYGILCMYVHDTTDITHKLYSSELRNSKRIFTFPAFTFSASEGTRGLSPTRKLRCSPNIFSRAVGHTIQLTHRTNTIVDLQDINLQDTIQLTYRTQYS